MFSDEAIERMVLDAFDELCADQGIEGPWADEGPVGLAMAPEPLRLGAVVDLWMRVENREETARQHIIERTTIFGSSQLQAVPDRDEEQDDVEAGEDEGEEIQESPEPLLDEIELRGRLLVDVINTVSQQLSDRRGAQELGDEMPPLDAVREAMIEAINLSFADTRLAYLWQNGAFLSMEDE
ncbi:MAG TPA: hypothetical protein VHB98_24355 [Chloroflexota bacterium]|jgi:hypothetical protein|nr:hypothetical protein [Chloroflexota bacterium]